MYYMLTFGQLNMLINVYLQIQLKKNIIFNLCSFYKLKEILFGKM